MLFYKPIVFVIFTLKHTGVVKKAWGSWVNFAVSITHYFSDLFFDLYKSEPIRKAAKSSVFSCPAN